VLESLVVTLDMYRRAFARGAVLAVKNWPVFGTVFAYDWILWVAGEVAASLGLVGGFLMSLVLAACLGSFLYLVEMMVRSGRVTWEDFGRSFTAYIWDFVGVLFAFWVLSQIATLTVSQLPQGPVVMLCLMLVALVLFNAVPELIYLGHYNLAGLLAASYQFIASNWIEWFPPNLLLLAGVLALRTYPVASSAEMVAERVATSLFFYFAMVVRGLLFIELDGSTRRSRIFRHKMGR
jgi:hypothetical protein